VGILNESESVRLLLQMATAPDGNGGVYKALKRTGMLQHMRSHGVRYVDCYSVDNAAARICEPAFVGACVERDAQVGARVVAKATPDERVGVFVQCAPPSLSELLCFSTGSSRP
jgi:UDP-N-acetylglucosamine/UDP-N-acetylgalactosamine diphosphorylase